MRKLDVVAQGRTLGIIIQKTVAFYIAKPPGRVRDLKVEIIWDPAGIQGNLSVPGTQTLTLRVLY